MRLDHHRQQRATWTGLDGSKPDSLGHTSSNNWSGPSGTTFSTGQPAFFDDTAGMGNTNVVIQPTGVTPYSATFNNNLLTYNVSNLSGNVGIAGTAGVIVNGPGTVNFNSQNTYTGGTVLNGGTLVITADNALGTAASSPTKPT